MTKFEAMVNDGKFNGNQICCMINHLDSNTQFEAWINAKSIQEVDRKLPQGYELMKEETFQNYFNQKTISDYSIELFNSQYIYYTDFSQLVDYGLMKYIDALKDEDYKKMERMDRAASERFFKHY